MNADLDFSPELFQGISEEAIDLVKKMTNKNPNLRPNIHDCKHHNWFKVSTSEQEKPLLNIIEKLNKSCSEYYLLYHNLYLIVKYHKKYMIKL